MPKPNSNTVPGEQCGVCKWMDTDRVLEQYLTFVCMHGSNGLGMFCVDANPNNDCKHFEEKQQ